MSQRSKGLPVISMQVPCELIVCKVQARQPTSKQHQAMTLGIAFKTEHMACRLCSLLYSVVIATALALSSHHAACKHYAWMFNNARDTGYCTYSMDSPGVSKDSHGDGASQITPRQCHSSHTRSAAARVAGSLSQQLRHSRCCCGQTCQVP